MSTRNVRYTSLFARSAPEMDLVQTDTGNAPPELIIDLTDETGAVPPRSAAPSLPRHLDKGVWLGARPLVTDATRAVPRGLFSLSAPPSHSRR